MRQTTGIIIFDAHNRVLLQHRDGQAPTSPNKWGLWGGSVEAGETVIEGAVRELEEELSIRILQSDLTFFGVYEDAALSKEMHAYMLADVGQFTYRQREGDDMGYFSRHELSQLVLTPKAKVILQDYFGTDL